MPRQPLSSLLPCLVTACALLLGGCDSSSRSDTMVSAAVPPRPGDDVATGHSGGRPEKARSWSDPLRFTYYGLPRRDPLLPHPIQLFNDGYVVGYDMARHLPLWASYRLFDGTGPAGEEERRHEGGPDRDARLGDNAPALEASGRDREVPPWMTLVPREPIAACYGANAGAETELNSDVVPMAPPVGWHRLQALDRAYAQRFHELWVLTGPLLRTPGGTDPGVTGLWKIQVVVDNGKTLTQAFLLPADEPQPSREHPLDLASHLTTVAAITERTGLSFFPDLHDQENQTRRQVLTMAPTSLWPTGGEATALTEDDRR